MNFAGLSPFVFGMECYPHLPAACIH
eukprot:SAG11_NODE_5698_length_1484_cov_1.132130_2_plen_25_part_01